MCGIEGLAETMGYVQSVLLPGERVAYHTQLHWTAYWRALVLSLFGALLLLAGDPVSAMIALVLFVLAAFVTIDPWTTEIAITNHRVLLKRGLLGRETNEIKINKVASIDVRQSILGSRLNFGTVIVRGTGGNVSPLAYVDAPFADADHISFNSSRIATSRHKGATLKHPGWKNGEVEWEPFPLEALASVSRSTSFSVRYSRLRKCNSVNAADVLTSSKSTYSCFAAVLSAMTFHGRCYAL